MSVADLRNVCSLGLEGKCLSIYRQMLFVSLPVICEVHRPQLSYLRRPTCHASKSPSD
jgi:hypothetical protein